MKSLATILLSNWALSGPLVSQTEPLSYHTSPWSLAYVTVPVLHNWTDRWEFHSALLSKPALTAASVFSSKPHCDRSLPTIPLCCSPGAWATIKMTGNMWPEKGLVRRLQALNRLGSQRGSRMHLGTGHLGTGHLLCCWKMPGTSPANWCAPRRVPQWCLVGQAARKDPDVSPKANLKGTSKQQKTPSPWEPGKQKEASACLTALTRGSVWGGPICYHWQRAAWKHTGQVGLK